MQEPNGPRGIDPGLCGDCTQRRVVASPKGSVFYLCQRHERDPRFRKYPPLPVLCCAAHEAQPQAEPG